MKKSMMSLVFLCFCLVLSGAALAQTPDGETPAMEDVCDGLSGAAFGACNAYCEAMDCDSANPHASERACSNQFNRFEKLTGNIPPCVCPCVQAFPDFGATVRGEVPIAECGLGLPGTNAEFTVLFTEAGFPFGGGIPEEDFGVCGPFLFAGTELLFTTVQEGDNCSRLLRAAADAQGVPCVPF